MTRRSLLRQLTGAPLARPCDVPWSAMHGDDRLRHCAQCDRDVWNLSAMTAREAEIRLLNARELPCVNYRVDDQGRLLSRPDARVPAARLGLGAAAFVATTLLSPGSGSLSGRMAAADQAAPNPDNKKADNKDQHASDQSKKKPFKNDDCPTKDLPAGTAALDPPKEPMRLGGALPPLREQPPAGTVTLKSKQPRELTIDGVTFNAPGTIQLPPGKHEAVIAPVNNDKGDKKPVRRSFVVKKDATVVLDLDR